MRSDSKSRDARAIHSTLVAVVSSVFLVAGAPADEAPGRLGMIWGTVVDATPECSPERCARLANSQSDEEARLLLQEIVGPQRAVGATVTVTNDRVQRETLTDAAGRYSFASLPAGPYTISARKVGADGKVRRSLSRGTETGKVVHLVLHDALLTVSGRIVDANGAPVAGAKVTGTPVPISEVGVPDRRHAVSDANGVYALTGFEPVNVYRVAGYLNGGSLDAPGALHTQVEIRVQAEGFRRDVASIPRVPLIAEAQFDAGLRLWQALAQLAAAKDDGAGWQEPRNRPRHITERNAITGIDIVLSPISAP